MQWTRDDYVVTDDPARLDLATIHAYLARESYWAAGIPQSVLARAIENSLCLGVYREARQIGFARIVTDRSTFAYLCDVFVDPEHRGLDLGKWLIECVVAHPDLQGLRRFCLMTSDAHGLYQPFGFKPMADATRYLEIHRPDIYRQREDSHG